MLKYKHIEAVRETRLWLGQVIVPTIIGATLIMSNPDYRLWIEAQISNIKNKIKRKRA